MKDNKIKVLIFSYLYPNKLDPTRGMFVYERVRYLSQFCDIKVIAPIPYFPKITFFKKWSKYRKIKKFYRKNNVEVYYPRFLLFPFNLFRFYIGKILYLSTKRLILDMHNKWSFDIIHAHFTYPCGIAASYLLSKIDKPLIITEHYGRFHFDIDKNSKMYKQYLKALNASSLNIAVSKRIENDMIRVLSNSLNVKMIPNGVDITKFYFVEKEFNNTWELLTIGNLFPLKGHELLINAIKILTDQGYEISLTIIGEGELKNKLLHKVSKLDLDNNISFLQKVNHSNLIQYFSKTHIYVHPSLSESFSVVTIEALACGIPVVVTECGGPEYFVNEEVGVVVPKDDDYLFANGIKKVIENYDIYKPNEITKYCGKHFSYEKIAKSIFSEYKRLLQ